MKELKTFVKEQRKQTHMTQGEFADRVGISLSLLRSIEQGKTNLNMAKVNQVLAMFGHQLGPVDSQLENTTVFDSNTKQATFSYREKPVVILERITFNPLDTPDWVNRLDSSSLIVTITGWDEGQQMRKQYQQPIILGQFITPYSKQPIFKINWPLTFKDEFQFGDESRFHEWTVVFDIDGLSFNNHESLRVDFDIQKEPTQ